MPVTIETRAPREEMPEEYRAFIDFLQRRMEKAFLEHLAPETEADAPEVRVRFQHAKKPE